MLVRVLFPGDTSSKTVTEPGTHMGSNQLLVENSSTHETKNHPTKNALSQKNMILHWYFRGFFFLTFFHQFPLIFSVETPAVWVGVWQLTRH